MEDAMKQQEEKREEADKERLELEDRYNKLVAATNLSDPSDIIDKFYHMEQVHAGLEQQRKESQMQLDALEEEARQVLAIVIVLHGP